VRNISSLVIDSLYDQVREGDTAVAGLYCDFLAQELSIAHMMGAILKQLVGRGNIPGYIREGFRRGGRQLRFQDLMKWLRMAIASLRQVFICIDALDECPPKRLPDLLMSLRDIIRECSGTRVFLTGRPHIRENIQRYFPKAFEMPIATKTKDIRNYLEKRLVKDDEPEAMDDGLWRDIMEIIPETVSDTCVGIFWTSTLPIMYTYQ